MEKADASLNVPPCGDVQNASAFAGISPSTDMGMLSPELITQTEGAAILSICNRGGGLQDMPVSPKRRSTNTKINFVGRSTSMLASSAHDGLKQCESPLLFLASSLANNCADQVGSAISTHLNQDLATMLIDSEQTWRI